MLATGVTWCIIIWAWIGAGYLVIDGGRWPVAVRVLSYVIYSAIIYIAVTQLL